MISAGEAAFKLTYQLSPIILTGGVATAIPGGSLPIISLTQAADFTTGLLGGADIDLDGFFANFDPIPGASLLDQKIGQYPFANQQIAANAVVVQPLSISLQMICPVQKGNSWAGKQATIMALQATLATHNLTGGTYTVMTPSFIYTNCVMLGMRDASNGESQQRQLRWQLDFEQPLISLAAAAAAQSALMSKLTSGTQITPNSSGNVTWSGNQTNVGTGASQSAPSVVPGSSGLTPAGGATGPPPGGATGSF